MEIELSQGNSATSETELGAVSAPAEVDVDNAKDTQSETEKKNTSMLGSLWEAVVKQGDQMSPLLLKRMPTLVILLVLLVLGGSYLGAFIFQIDQMFLQCSEDNNCISCAITLEEVSGSDCERLASTNMNVAAGCASIPIANNYTIITEIITSINTTIESIKNDLPSELYTSLSRHNEIKNILQTNSLDQMIDPDVTKARAFLATNFFGLSDAFANAESINSLSEDLVIAASLKILYSYIAIGCVAFSADSVTSVDIDSISYTKFDICGCSLQCPVQSSVIGGAIDVSLNVPNMAQNGLGSLELYIPNDYVQSPDESADPPFSDEKAVVEFQYFNTLSAKLQHCPTSVFTQTPAQLNSVLYQCCTEKSAVEKLSETSAFAGLVLTFAVIATTIVFYPFSPKDESIRSEFEDIVRGTFGGD